MAGKKNGQIVRTGNRSKGWPSLLPGHGTRERTLGHETRFESKRRKFRSHVLASHSKTITRKINQKKKIDRIISRRLAFTDMWCDRVSQTFDTPRVLWHSFFQANGYSILLQSTEVPCITDYRLDPQKNVWGLVNLQNPSVATFNTIYQGKWHAHFRTVRIFRHNSFAPWYLIFNRTIQSMEHFSYWQKKILLIMFL